MDAVTKPSRDMHLVSLEGELDRSVYGERLRDIRQSFAETPGDLVIDCAKLIRISPMAVAGLVRLKEFVEGQGFSIRFVRAAPEVAAQFARGGLAGVETAAASEEAAAAPPAEEAPAAPRRAVSPSPDLILEPPPEETGPAAGAEGDAAFAGPNLATEVARLRTEMAHLESDLKASREEAAAAVRAREQASSLYVELRARAESLREENKRLAEDLARASARDVLAPLREVQERIRAALDRAQSQAEACREGCRAVESSLADVGAAPADAEGPAALARAFFVAMMQVDPTLAERLGQVRRDLAEARDRIDACAGIVAALEEESAFRSAS